MEKRKIDNIRTDDELIFNILPPPQGIIKWSMLLIVLLGVLLVLVARLLPYRQSLGATFELSNTNTPQCIVATQSGTISSISIADGQEVKQGTPLVILRTQTQEIVTQVPPLRASRPFILTKQSNTTQTVRLMTYVRTTAPVAGRVFIPKLWTVGEQVKAKDSLFLLLPNRPDKMICRLQIDASDKPKVRIGQKVTLHLTASQLMIEGYISQISQWQTEGHYNALVTLPDTMKQVANERGKAEIVVKETTLMQQIFLQMNNLWTKAK